MGLDLEAMRVVVEHRVDASPERVWAVLSDLPGMAAFSPEVVSLAWLDEPGGRFAAINSRGGNEWSVVGHVLAWEPPLLLRWAVSDPAHPSSTWAYELAAEGAGTRVRHSFQHGPGASLLRRMAEAEPRVAEMVVARRSRMLAEDMLATLVAATRSLPRSVPSA